MKMVVLWRVAPLYCTFKAEVFSNFSSNRAPCWKCRPPLNFCFSPLQVKDVLPRTQILLSEMEGNLLWKSTVDILDNMSENRNGRSTDDIFVVHAVIWLCRCCTLRICNFWKIIYHVLGYKIIPNFFSHLQFFHIISYN